MFLTIRCLHFTSIKMFHKETNKFTRNFQFCNHILKRFPKPMIGPHEMSNPSSKKKSLHKERVKFESKKTQCSANDQKKQLYPCTI
eukprot:c21991_g2_i1 orf=87-344(+)